MLKRLLELRRKNEQYKKEDAEFSCKCRQDFSALEESLKAARCISQEYVDACYAGK